MAIFIKDLKRIPKLCFGFIIMAIGIVFTIRANIGISPWSVFHQGIENMTGIPFGMIVQIVGFIILTLSVVFLRVKIGIGTILNVFLIGLFIDLFNGLFEYYPSSISTRLFLFIIGFISFNFGTSLYISTRLGAGPRDGLFVGFVRLTKIPVKYVKPIIEITVTIIGFFLGGNVGYGTLFLMIFSGYLIQLFFKVFGYDPKDKTQSKFSDYFLKSRLYNLSE